MPFSKILYTHRTLRRARERADATDHSRDRPSFDDRFMAMMLVFVVYGLVSAASAIPGPERTAGAAYEARSSSHGWSPRPTHDPLHRHDLLKRQDLPRTCGYVSGDVRMYLVSFSPCFPCFVLHRTRHVDERHALLYFYSFICLKHKDGGL